MKHAPKNKISNWLFGRLGLWMLLALVLFLPQNRVWGFSADLVPGVGEILTESSMFIGGNCDEIQYDASGYTVAPNTGSSSSILGTTSKQLQKKFGHASDFGVSGNYNKANAVKFNSSINQHINSSGVKAIQGTYRGKNVIHHVNPQTGLNVIENSSGAFQSGWKLSPQQLEHVLSSGKLGGG